MQFRYTLLMVGIVLPSSGCGSLLKSRYAMSDPVYAEKYAEGAPKGDIAGKMKQAIDARFVESLGGWYLSGGLQKVNGSSDPFTGAEAGFEFYPVSWFSHRLGAAGYWGADQGYVGVDGGVRFQLPTRATPFVGLGGVTGLSRGVRDVSGDLKDNDGDTLVDESDERDSTVDSCFAAVYPEVGAHLWLNGNIRLSASGKYWVTSFGRAHDDWLVGGQLTFFTRP